MNMLLLSSHEARVLAALTEKSLTTPDYYPMTVNGLMAASNQKSSRSPVLSLTEGEVGHALTTLEESSLVSRDDRSSRTTKWRSKLLHQLLLKPATQAVLVTLMLRGPQTTAELKSHSAALNGPDDADAVQAALDDLADRAQPLVCTLPRAVGQSAVRHAHLLCGEVDFDASEAMLPAAPRGGAATDARLVELEARVLALEQQLAVLVARTL